MASRRLWQSAGLRTFRWRAPVGIQRFIFHNFLSTGLKIHRGVPIGSPDLSWSRAGHIRVLIPVVIFHIMISVPI
jgi:hypothetical protein